MPSKRKKLGCISTVLVLLCLVVISSVYMIETSENSSTLLIINRVDDLLAGDLWEYLTLSDLFPKISNAEIVGLGTTSREHNGEIIFFSDGKNPRCFWANPAMNGTYEELSWTDEKLPFCAIALLNPNNMYEFKGVYGDVHEHVIEKIKELGIDRAAVRVDGTFTSVDVSIAYLLPKEGLAKETVHVVNGNFRENHVADKHKWTMVGFYTASEDEQKIISTKGKPLHLHGIERDGNIGGHIVKGFASSCIIRIYPIKIKDYEILESDLVIEGLKVLSNTDEISFNVANIGSINAENVKVSVMTNGSQIYSSVIGLPFNSSQQITFQTPINLSEKMIVVEVDPENEIYESREENNFALCEPLRL